MVLKIAKKIWLDGKLVDWQKAKISVLSQSLQRGSAIFESMSFYRTEQGSAIFRMKDHLERFFISARIIKIDIPFTKGELAKALVRTVKASRQGEGGIRLLAFLAEPTFFLLTKNDIAQVAVAVFSYLKMPLVTKIKIASFVRPFNKITKAKVAANYALGRVAQIEAKRSGFEDAVFLDEANNISEGPTCNIFLVKRGAIFTPFLGRVLSGVTRDSVIKIAKGLGYQVREKAISKKELYQADEVFRTSSSMKIWPIIKIDAKIINRGRVGLITKRLQDAFEEVLCGRDKRYFKWLTFVR